MTPSLDALLANGGVAGLLVALAAVAKVGFDWYRDRHDIKNRDHLQELTEGTTAVSDASAANAIVLESLKAVHEENARLTKKVDGLERQNAAKDNQIKDLQNRVADMRKQVEQLALELANLRTT